MSDKEYLILKEYLSTKKDLDDKLKKIKLKIEIFCKQADVSNEFTSIMKKFQKELNELNIEEEYNV